MQFKDLRKVNAILIFGFAVLAALYFGASFFIPITFAGFLAALMNPVCNKLEDSGMGNFLASLLSTLAVFVIVGGLFYLLFYQLKVFADDLPEIKEELNGFLKDMQAKLSSATGLSPAEQKDMFKERSDAIMESVQNQLTTILGSILNASVKFLLVLVYVFLFLLNRGKYISFVQRYVPSQKEPKSRKILSKTGKVVHHYLWGRFKVMAILAAMYIASFIVFDVRYAVLLTVFGAIVTIVPYIGPLLSGVIPIIFAIVFGMELSQVLLFAGVVLVIQLIESYILEPVIIGSEVRLSPLAIIIAIIIGGMIWGVAGMILFVPLVAIVKIIADHTENLRPIGFLLGSNEDKSKESWMDKLKNSVFGKSKK